MNGFQKEYWEKQSDVARKNWKYHKFAWLISIVLNLLLFHTEDLETLFVKIVALAMLIMGLVEVKLNLPNFFIEEDRHNETEVRVLMVLAPFVIYLLLLFGWFS